jgi:hypothetical protein
MNAYFLEHGPLRPMYFKRKEVDRCLKSRGLPPWKKVLARSVNGLFRLSSSNPTLQSLVPKAFACAAVGVPFVIRTDPTVGPPTSKASQVVTANERMREPRQAASSDLPSIESIDTIAALNYYVQQVVGSSSQEKSRGVKGSSRTAQIGFQQCDSEMLHTGQHHDIHTYTNKF